jgi:hypothetical protein
VTSGPVDSRPWHFGTSIERLQARFFTGYDYRKECAVVLERIATAGPDCVIALPPSGLRDAFLRVIRRVPGVTVAVHDTPENILERITFYDIDSRLVDKHLTDVPARLLPGPAQPVEYRVTAVPRREQPQGGGPCCRRVVQPDLLGHRWMKSCRPRGINQGNAPVGRFACR